MSWAKMFEATKPSGLPVELLRREVLNLGCGLKHFPDALNLDVSPNANPDLVHELNLVPWPLPGDHFREVRAFDIIEHLDDFIATMAEIYRVCADGAIVRITVPHFSCANAYTDPTHRRIFGCSSFDYVTGASEIQFFERPRFRILSRRLVFYPTLLNKLVGRLANRYPARYERRWAWLFPAWYLYFEFEVRKDS